MNVILPPGLNDKNIEFFTCNRKAMALYDGRKVNYLEMPKWVRQKVIQDLLSDPIAYCRIKKRCNSENIEVLEQEHVKCRFGGFNNTPDLTPEGVLNYDPPCCDEIATCEDFGIGCKVPGKLTRKEFIVIQNVVSGLPDAEIADALNNSVATIRTHMRRIFKKLNIYNRAELLKFASENNIKN